MYHSKYSCFKNRVKKQSVTRFSGYFRFQHSLSVSFQTYHNRQNDICIIQNIPTVRTASKFSQDAIFGLVSLTTLDHSTPSQGKGQHRIALFPSPPSIGMPNCHSPIGLYAVYSMPYAIQWHDACMIHVSYICLP